MAGCVKQLSDISKLGVPPRQMGRRMTMILTPDKAKIEQVKRRSQPPPAPQPPDSSAPPTLSAEKPAALEPAAAAEVPVERTK